MYRAFLLIIIVTVGCIQTESRTEASEEAIAVSTSPPQGEYQALSLLDSSELTEKTYSPNELRSREQKLADAKDKFDQNPDSLEYILWYGRRLAYLSKYREALNVFTEGLKKHPNSYRLLRHRGHRFISIRQFDRAIKDLEEAAFHIRGLAPIVEEDGIPNSKNMPLGTIQYNIWYHLGLAYYLSGDYDKAISAYKKCMELSTNNDLLVSTTDWLYMTYRKIGNNAMAEKILEPIKSKMRLIENFDYHNRLMMYKGLKKPEDIIDLSVGAENEPISNATLGYGVGNWFLYNGNPEQARQIFNRVILNGNWDYFGYIASEVDLRALRTF